MPRLTPPPPTRHDQAKPPPLQPFDDNSNPADPHAARALHAVRETVDSVEASIRPWRKDGDDDHPEITTIVVYQTFLVFSNWVYHLVRAICESYNDTLMILMNNKAKPQVFRARLERI
jgi:hypothetical protein